MSTARLEAEAAFAARPPESAPASRPQITVRRARTALLAPPVALGDGPPETTPANKSPRVFRVDAAQDSEPERAAQSPHDDAPKTVPGLPRRRRGADRRPGPVVRLVQPLPAPVDDRPTTRQLAAMAATLALIGPVLQAIERAQSFVFIDGRFAHDWQALSERASALRAGLRAPRARLP